MINHELYLEISRSHVFIESIRSPTSKFFQNKIAERFNNHIITLSSLLDKIDNCENFANRSLIERISLIDNLLKEISFFEKDILFAVSKTSTLWKSIKDLIFENTPSESAIKTLQTKLKLLNIKLCTSFVSNLDQYPDISTPSCLAAIAAVYNLAVQDETWKETHLKKLRTLHKKINHLTTLSQVDVINASRISLLAETLFAKDNEKVTCQIGTFKLTVAKFLLISSSTFFKAALTSEFKESKEKLIELKNISSNDFKELLKIFSNPQRNLNNYSLDALINIYSTAQMLLVKDEIIQKLLNAINKKLPIDSIEILDTGGTINIHSICPLTIQILSNKSFLHRLKHLDISNINHFTDDHFNHLSEYIKTAQKISFNASCFHTSDILAQILTPSLNLHKLHVFFPKDIDSTAIPSINLTLSKITLFLSEMKNMKDRNVKIHLMNAGHLPYNILKTIVNSCSTHIETLVLTGSKLEENEIISLLPHLTKVKHLDLTSCPKANNRVYEEFAEKLANILTFKINNAGRIEDSGLKQLLAKHTNLRILDLGWQNRLTSPTIAEIGDQLPKLRELNLKNCNKLIDDGLEKILQNCTHLEKLNIDFCAQITVKSFEDLGKHKTLYKISLKSVFAKSFVLDEDNLKKLTERKKSLELEMPRDNLKPDTLQFFPLLYPNTHLCLTT